MFSLVTNRQKGCEGIVNGMDVEEWDPRKDKFLTVKYDKTTVHAGKAAAKEALQAELGLPVDPTAPLFAFIGRLEEQKGVDILVSAIPKILQKVPKAQVAILGTGKAKFEKMVAALDKSHKGQAKGVVKFSAPLAHTITAGADFIFVPSRFEPCGLIQLHAMQYGTVPLVSSTGGLVDTVKEGVTGFHMGAMDPDSLLQADVEAIVATAGRAAEAFATPLFKEMVYNCISQVCLGLVLVALQYGQMLLRVTVFNLLPLILSCCHALPIEDDLFGTPARDLPYYCCKMSFIC